MDEPCLEVTKALVSPVLTQLEEWKKFDLWMMIGFCLLGSEKVDTPPWTWSEDHLNPVSTDCSCWSLQKARQPVLLQETIQTTYLLFVNAQKHIPLSETASPWICPPAQKGLSYKCDSKSQWLTKASRSSSFLLYFWSLWPGCHLPSAE